MTTTIWILVIVAMLCIGMIAGLVLSFWINNFDLSGLKSICNEILEQLSIETDKNSCMRNCGKRRTKSASNNKTSSNKIAKEMLDDAKRQLKDKADDGLNDFLNRRGSEQLIKQSNIESANSAKDGEATYCEGEECKLTFCGGDGDE